MIVPSVEWIENDITINPSGSRHLKDTVAGYLKTLGTGAGQHLDFGNLDISDGNAISNTKLCYARVANYNGASGIYNLRFYLASVNDFGFGTYRFLKRNSLHFQGNRS